MPQQTINSIETGLSLRTKLNANFAELYSLFANNATQTFNFDATTIPSLALWLDANDSTTLFNSTIGGSNVTEDGATIARWKDKSTFNLDAIQSVENSRPILKKSLINGKNCIRMDGINDFLTSNLSLNGSTAFTCYFVCRGQGTFPLFSIGYRVGMGDGVFLAANFSGAGVIFYGLTQASAGSITSATSMLKGTFTGGKFLTAYQNENEGSTVNGNSSYFIQSALTLIGALAFTNGNIWQYGAGDYCEILVFSSELTPLQRQSVELYLNQKWAIF